MNELDLIFEISKKLNTIKTESHAFYIADDVAHSKVFFPSKRIPLLVAFSNDNNIEKTVKKLILCYGGDKTVFVISKNNEVQSTLEEFNSIICKTQFELDDKQNNFPMVLLLPSETLTESKKFDFSDLIEIMIKLRGEGGCEWDRAQTHESIRINLIEEAYELVEAIDKADRGMLLEETGDVLLQAVFHTHIEMDKNSFDYGDMLTALCEKLLTRHTHIFGQNHAENAEQALSFWNDAKKVEKGYTSFTHAMDLVPKNLPSLLYSFKIQKKAKKAGFDWNDINGAIDKISEELSEVLSASEENKAMEGGDLLFAVVNVLRFLDIEPELALKAATQKFIHRFELVEIELTKDGSEMASHTLEEMDAMWNSIKMCE